MQKKQNCVNSVKNLRAISGKLLGITLLLGLCESASAAMFVQFAATPTAPTVTQASYCINKNPCVVLSNSPYTLPNVHKNDWVTLNFTLSNGQEFTRYCQALTEKNIEKCNLKPLTNVNPVQYKFICSGCQAEQPAPLK